MVIRWAPLGWALGLGSLALVGVASISIAEQPAGGIPRDTLPGKELPSVAEARVRARLLHETIRGTLQVMHRDFFDEDDAHAIPSSSLEDVFASIKDEFGVQVKWLNVETDVVNVDHEPANGFERKAAERLSRGEPFHEDAAAEPVAQESNPDLSGKQPSPAGGDSMDVREGTYRYVGQIRLRSQCLKCHVKRRSDNRDRVAGLSLTIPITTP